MDSCLHTGGFVRDKIALKRRHAFRAMHIANYVDHSFGQCQLFPEQRCTRQSGPRVRHRPGKHSQRERHGYFPGS